MCLARPGEVIEVKENSVVLDYGDQKREVKTDYLQPEKGEYAIVMSKQVVQKMSEEEVGKSVSI